MRISKKCACVWLYVAMWPYLRYTCVHVCIKYTHMCIHTASADLIYICHIYIYIYIHAYTFTAGWDHRGGQAYRPCYIPHVLCLFAASSMSRSAVRGELHGNAYKQGRM